MEWRLDSNFKKAPREALGFGRLVVVVLLLYGIVRADSLLSFSHLIWHNGHKSQPRTRIRIIPNHLSQTWNSIQNSGRISKFKCHVVALSKPIVFDMSIAQESCHQSGLTPLKDNEIVWEARAPSLLFFNCFLSVVARWAVSQSGVLPKSGRIGDMIIQWTSMPDR